MGLYPKVIQARIMAEQQRLPTALQAGAGAGAQRLTGGPVGVRLEVRYGLLLKIICVCGADRCGRAGRRRRWARTRKIVGPLYYTTGLGVELATRNSCAARVQAPPTPARRASEHLHGCGSDPLAGCGFGHSYFQWPCWPHL